MKKILFFLCLASFSGVYAQQSFRPGIYFNHMNYYNPASGWDQEMRGEASLYIQHKLINSDVFVKNAPNIFANYIGSIGEKRRHHFSASYTFDKYSYYVRNIINGGYAYSLDFGSKGYLTFGTRVSLALDYVNGNDFEEPLGNNISGLRVLPDFDLGIDYRFKGLNIGIGARNIVATKARAEGYALYHNQRLIHLYVSYQFFIKQKVGLAPIAMVHYERNFGVDLGLNLNILKVVDVSYIFRTNHLRHIGTLGVKFAKRFYIGVAVDGAMLTSDINADLNLRYRF